VPTKRNSGQPTQETAGQPTQETAGQPTQETAGQPTQETAGQPTQETGISNERMIYILSGIAFILLLVLCFILGFWCYRRSQHKRTKRLFTVFVSAYDET